MQSQTNPRNQRPPEKSRQIGTACFPAAIEIGLMALWNVSMCTLSTVLPHVDCQPSRCDDWLVKDEGARAGV